jgi:hypothetical protein
MTVCEDAIEERDDVHLLLPCKSIRNQINQHTVSLTINPSSFYSTFPFFLLLEGSIGTVIMLESSWSTRRSQAKATRISLLELWIPEKMIKKFDIETTLDADPPAATLHQDVTLG